MTALVVPLAASAAWGVEGTWAPSGASHRSGASAAAVSVTSADAAPTDKATPGSSTLKWGPVRTARASSPVASQAASPAVSHSAGPIFAKPETTILLTAAPADDDDLFIEPKATKPKPAAPKGTAPKAGAKTDPDPFENDPLTAPKDEPEEEMFPPPEDTEPAPKGETIPEPEANPEPAPLKNPMQPAQPKLPRTPPRTPTRPRPSSEGYARPRTSTPLADLEDCDTAKKRMLANRLANIGLNIRVTGQQGTDVPPECDLDPGHFEDRNWCDTTLLWKASALCHKPLYFEDVQLERYGHDWGPVLQPVVSGVHFFGTLPVLPYKMGLQTPNECVYALGYYRPGSCAPYMLSPIPFSLRAALFEACAWVGGAAAIP